jgi:hypothetical protein
MFVVPLVVFMIPAVVLMPLLVRRVGRLAQRSKRFRSADLPLGAP